MDDRTIEAWSRRRRAPARLFENLGSDISPPTDQLLEVLARAAAGLAVRTGRGPLRRFWAGVYEALAHAVAAYVARGLEASAYVAGSVGFGDPVYGISDIDLAIVVADPAGRPGLSRKLVKRRSERLGERWPPLGRLVDVTVYEEDELRRAASASALVFGLDCEAGRPSERAIYFGRRAVAQATWIHEGPGLYRPLGSWRRVRGRERRPNGPLHDEQRQRVAAWLGLQSWWRWTFNALVSGAEPSSRSMSVKLVTEPARILLWLMERERFRTRRALLERALERFPAEEPRIRRALELDETIAHPGPGALAELLPTFVRLSREIADRLTTEAATAPSLAVRLSWGGPDDLPLAPGALEGVSALSAVAPDLHPLADWRAVVFTRTPDESFVRVDRDPGDAAVLEKAVELGRRDPYPAIRVENLLVLAAGIEEGRGRMRGVQCPPTDPVSFALLDGSSEARFAELAGWSARDWARRAVAEHAAWLEDAGAMPSAQALCRSLLAARAGLFLESVEAGDPELLLTMAATARRLVEREPHARLAVEDAYAAYREHRVADKPVAGKLVDALTAVVRRLDAYRPRFRPA